MIENRVINRDDLTFTAARLQIRMPPESNVAWSKTHSDIYRH